MLAIGPPTEFVIRMRMLISSSPCAENQRKSFLKAIEKNDEKYLWQHKTIV
jgi:hypothetical protein